MAQGIERNETGKRAGLSALGVKSASAGMHAAGSGLYLKVTDTGTRSWIFRFQIDGKRREMGLGVVAAKSLAVARAEAAALQVQVRQGVDPLAARHEADADAEAQTARAEAAATTFGDVAEQYIAAHRAGWRNAKHAAQWSATLATHAATLTDLPVGEVDTASILRVLRPLWTTKTETASRVRSRVELVLSYAIAHGRRDGPNPAIWRGHLDALLPKPTKVTTVEHQPALPYPQLPAFLATLRTVPGQGARALEFAILTAARSGEVRGATWREIDTDAAVWTVPGSRMKAGREHRVPITAPALALLKTQKQGKPEDLVFPGMEDRLQLSDMTLAAVVRRLNGGPDGPRWVDPANGRPVVPHGFRSTFRDWAGEASRHPRELAEAALAHVVGDAVERAYRRGDALEKRRELMNDWAAWCTGGQGGEA